MTSPTPRWIAAATLGLAFSAMAGEPAFPASQYGQVTLRMPQSLISLESVLGGNPNFEMIGDYDAEDRIRQLARPVGRLDILLGGGSVSTCTASLLPGGYAITNHHCIPGDGTHGAVLEASLLMGYLTDGSATGTERFMIDTKPVEANATLDYAIIKVVGADPSTRWGAIKLDLRDPRPGEALLIVHHPAGLPQHVTRGGCRADAPSPLSGDDIRHRCDTLGGSSGSPVFSDSSGTVLGLHYAGSMSPGLAQFNSAKRMSQILTRSTRLQDITGTRPSPAPTLTAPTPAPAPVAPPPTPSAPKPPDLAATIRALPDGGMSAWDDAVRRLLIERFDKNANGVLDSAAELDAVTCDVWTAVDAGVRQAWSGGLARTYGFLPGGLWIAAALGIDESARQPAATALGRCNLMPAVSPSAPPPAAAGLATTVQGIPTSDGWDRAVGRALIVALDRNGSGSLDTAAEVQAVGCDTWTAIDQKVRTRYSSGVAVVYGFDPGFFWVGYALGIDEGQRAVASAAVRSCNLSEGSSSPTPAPTPSAPTRTVPEIVESLLRIPHDAEDWASRSAEVLTSSFDSDRSGSLQTTAELSRIDCRVWRALDGAVRAEWEGTGLHIIYGFEASKIWVGYALGIDEGLRATAYSALQSCNLTR